MTPAQDKLLDNFNRVVEQRDELLESLKETLRVLVRPKGFPDKGKGRTQKQQAAFDRACAAVANSSGEAVGP